MTDGKGADQRSQTIQGSQTSIGGNAGNVFSGEFHGPVIVDSSGAMVSIPPKISNVSEHLLRLSKLREWKDMHTETQFLLNVISNLVIDLEQCQYLPESYFDKTMKSAEDEWKICSPRLIRLGHIIAKFRHISSEDCVIHCLEHAHSIATVSLMIADVKTVGNATNLERFIGGVKNDFEAALLIADSEIVSLVDEFALEIAKDLEKVNRRNE